MAPQGILETRIALFRDAIEINLGERPAHQAIRCLSELETACPQAVGEIAATSSGSGTRACRVQRRPQGGGYSYRT